MPADAEVDSGIETLSMPESREDSPVLKEAGGGDAPKTSPMKMAIEDAEDDDEMDETLAERLWGLTEMFPESVRNATWALTTGSISGVKSLFSFSRSALWIFFSSSAILFAPVIFELERSQMEEMQRQQQRQILLGPSAAVSSGAMSSLGMPVPPPSLSQAPAPPPPPTR